MLKNHPFVSVVVISKDRHELLVNAVQSLKNMDYPKDKYEIVVVEECDEPVPIEGVNYVFLPRRNLGLGYARNHGVKNSKGEIVAFTDDDVTVDKNWLKEITKPFRDENIMGVGGLVRVQSKNIFGYAEEILGVPGGGVKRLLESENEVVPTKALSGCNCAYRKKIFNEFNFRETDFGKFGGDDWWLARCVSEKYKCVFNPKAIVYHKARANLVKIFNLFYRRQIHDFLARRYLYKKSKFLSVFSKIFGCVILKILVAAAIVLLFGWVGTLSMIFAYYLFNLISVRKVYKYLSNKASFFVYPVVKFFSDMGVLKGEIICLLKKESYFDNILKNY